MQQDHKKQRIFQKSVSQDPLLLDPLALSHKWFIWLFCLHGVSQLLL